MAANFEEKYVKVRVDSYWSINPWRTRLRYPEPYFLYN